MSILSGFFKTKKYRKTDTGYQLQSEWTSASTVEMADGNTAETNLGAIQGITDSLTATSSNIALSAKAGNNLQGQIDTVNSNLGVIGSYYNVHYKTSSVSANTLTFKDIYTPTDDGVYLVKVSCEISGSISSGYFRLGLADGNQTNFPNSNGRYVSAYASIDKKAVSLSLVVFLNSKKSVKLAFEGTKACDLYSSMEVLRIR